MAGVSSHELFTVSKVFSQDDFDTFAALSGDDNPIHVDAAFAARTRFGKPVAHGMLLYSILSSGVAVNFSGWLQGSVALKFVTPTYTGEQIIFRMLPTGWQEDRNRVTLLVEALRPTGDLAFEGSLVLAREYAPPQDAPLETAPQTAAQFGRMQVGQAASRSRVFTPEDHQVYQHLVGLPPLAGEALLTGAVPVPLLGGMFSDLLGTELPGRGTNWLKQQITYLAPARLGEAIQAHVQITRLRLDKALVNLATWCTAADGQLLCRGEALVLVRDLEA